MLLTSKPPRNLPDVIESEYLRIRDLLSPGARRQIEANARLRALAVLEAALAGQKAQPTEGYLDKLAKRVRIEPTWTSAFPGIATLTIDPSPNAKGITISVTKKGGEQITLVPAGTNDSAVVAVKRVSELDYLLIIRQGHSS